MSSIPSEVAAAPNAGRDQALRVAILFLLVLALQIPSLFMSFLVNERRHRRDEAAAEIASKWGAAQTIAGPALIVPWTRRWSDVNDKGVRRERESRERLVLLPESLHVASRLDTQTRRRGIYEVPVYRLDARIAGRFESVDLAKLGVPPESVDWPRAVLAIGISDVRALQDQVRLEWDGRSLACEPGTEDTAELGAGIHAELPLDGPPWGRTFELPVRLNGTRGAYFTPFGRQTTVELTGAWKDPSFQGNWLPVTRALSDTGFRAAWSIPSLGRNYPQAWLTSPGGPEAIQRSAFGVDLVPAIDAYRLCERTVKYELLFFVLTFTAFWLLEVLGGRLLHPIQYVLMGAALCLFLMLELSLSEHLGFGGAYALASVAVVGLIAFYASAVLGSRLRAALVGAGLGLLYACHYVVLRNEDYALLLGSLLFFGALVAVMAATRRINWYGTARR